MADLELQALSAACMYAGSSSSTTTTKAVSVGGCLQQMQCGKECRCIAERGQCQTLVYPHEQCFSEV